MDKVSTVGYVINVVRAYVRSRREVGRRERGGGFCCRGVESTSGEGVIGIDPLLRKRTGIKTAVIGKKEELKFPPSPVMQGRSGTREPRRMACMTAFLAKLGSFSASLGTIELI